MKQIKFGLQLDLPEGWILEKTEELGLLELYFPEHGIGTALLAQYQLASEVAFDEDLLLRLTGTFLEELKVEVAMGSVQKRDTCFYLDTVAESGYWLFILKQFDAKLLFLSYNAPLFGSGEEKEVIWQFMNSVDWMGSA